MWLLTITFTEYRGKFEADYPRNILTSMQPAAWLANANANREKTGLTAVLLWACKLSAQEFDALDGTMLYGREGLRRPR